MVQILYTSEDPNNRGVFLDNGFCCERQETGGTAEVGNLSRPVRSILAA